MSVRDLIFDIQTDIDNGILSFNEIAAKYEVPISWLYEIIEQNNSFIGE